jgi:hypothetical protein
MKHSKKRPGDPMESMCSGNFCGQVINKKQIDEIAEIIETFPKLSRAELANTICEIFSWEMPRGTVIGK